MSKHSTRRQFLETSAKVTTLAAAPLLIPGSALGLADQAAANDRITMGLIGCGGHGAGWNLDRMFRNPIQQVTAVCDVDSHRMSNAARKVSNFYKAKKRSSDCTEYPDFRDLINEAGTDAIAVCTTDHWHVIPALMAIKAKKNVICEKPLTLTVEEGQILVKAVKDSGVTFQVASENRSIESYIRLVELVRAGVFGKITHVDVTLPTGNKGRGNNYFNYSAPPKNLNYEMWQGQAALAPYCPARVHNTFRWNLLYSGGVITDWSAHLIDLTHWGTDKQLTGPVSVEGKCTYPAGAYNFLKDTYGITVPGKEGIPDVENRKWKDGEKMPQDYVWDTAETFSVDYKYADGMTVNLSASRPGIKFHGTDGWIEAQGWRGPVRADDMSKLQTKVPEDKKLRRPRTDGQGGEHMDFTDAILEKRQPYNQVEVGHRTICLSHLGNISMLLGEKKLTWNPDKEVFEGEGAEQANKLCSRKQREPWTIANVDSWVNVKK